MRKDREKLKAVSDDKLVDLFKNLGLYDSVLEGKLKCKFCGEIVTLDSISAIFPESGSIKIVCDKPSCLAGFNNFLKQQI